MVPMMLAWFKQLTWALELVGRRECKQWWLVILQLLSFAFSQIYFLCMGDGHILEYARFHLIWWTFSITECLHVFSFTSWLWPVYFSRILHKCLLCTYLFVLWQVVTYFFYKNLTFTLTQFWFTFQTGFSGQRFYDDWFQSLYNVIFTALPVIIVGLFDKVLHSFFLTTLFMSWNTAIEEMTTVCWEILLFCENEVYTCTLPLQINTANPLLFVFVVRMSVLPYPKSTLSSTERE